MARNRAVSTPMGTPIRMAPAVPAREVSTKGRMPNCPWLPFQVAPNRKSATPIWAMAGRPEITRYTLMNSTQATATKPHRKKRAWTKNSTTSRVVRRPKRALKRASPLGRAPPCSPRSGAWGSSAMTFSSCTASTPFTGE